MEMTLETLDFLRLLPVFMQGDEANIALSKAVDALIAIPSTHIKAMRVWDSIDQLTDSECDEMAWELEIDWYDSTMTLDQKRETIKYAQQIKRKRGTKWSVERVVSIYLGDGIVSEWFEYGGKPYSFKISTNAKMTAEIEARFIAMIKVTKNTRSHIDTIDFQRSSENQLYLCGIVTSMTKSIIGWNDND
jgi:phage tail P2-like protein